MAESILTVLRSFREVDLRSVNQHMSRIIIPLMEDQILNLDSEVFPPALVHLSMEDFLLDHRSLQEFSCPMSEATHVFRYGLLTFYCRFQASQLKHTCYGCDRPLQVFRVILTPTEKEPGGFCPMCHMRNLWTLEAQGQAWELMGNQPDTYDAAISWAKKYQSTVLDLVMKREVGYVEEWNGRERKWWANEKSTQSAAYMSFQMSLEEERGLTRSQ